MASKPKPPPDALSRYIKTNAEKFPIANPPLAGPPQVLQPGEIPNSGIPYVPAEPGMGSGPGGTSTPATGGGGDKNTTPDNPQLDWRAYLTNWGFTDDIVNELDKLFRTYADPNQAAAMGIAYIRGTDWYKTTFPGIEAGMKLGVVNDEAGYRAYTNQLNDVYQRYFGRTVSGQEVSDALTAGHTANYVNAHFSGQAYINANKNNIQYLLGNIGPGQQATQAQLDALGDQQAGLDNALGPEVQRRLDLATKQLSAFFGGGDATPALAVSKIGRLISPSLGSAGPGDVAA